MAMKPPPMPPRCAMRRIRNIHSAKKSTGTTQERIVGSSVSSISPENSTPLPSSRVASSGSTRFVTKSVLPSTGSRSSPRMRSCEIETFATLPASTSASNSL
jgi:hypothetical protein